MNGQSSAHNSKPLPERENGEAAQSEMVPRLSDRYYKKRVTKPLYLWAGVVTMTASGDMATKRQDGFYKKGGGTAEPVAPSAERAIVFW